MTITSEEKLEAHRYAEVLLEMAEKLACQVQWKSARLPRLTGDPEHAAHVTRSELGLSPNTPIENLTQAIEKVGVLVLVIPIQLDGRDAFSGWAGSEEQRPVIVMVNGASGDRYRFSMAHHSEVFYFRGSSYRMRGKEPVTLTAKPDLVAVGNTELL